MKLDIPRMPEERIFERGLGRDKPAAIPASMAGTTVASAHFALAMLLQFGNYGFYLAGNGTTAELSWGELFTLPLAQAPTLLIAFLLGLLVAFVYRRGSGRSVVFVVALACNAWLVLDQRVFGVLFTHFTFELVDDSAWSWFIERVFRHIDPMLFIGIAGWIIAMVWTHQGIWGGPWASGLAALGERATRGRLAKIGLQSGVGVALAVAGAAIIVLISASADLRGLNSHPLATVLFDQIVTPRKLAPLNPQVNVFAPRYGSVLMGPDALQGEALSSRIGDFGGARPNLVLIEVGADPLANWKGQAPLWNEAVVFDHVVPGSASRDVLVDEFLTRLGAEGYATATMSRTDHQQANALGFTTNVCAYLSAPAGFNSWIRERRNAERPLAVHVKLNERQAAPCENNPREAELGTLTAALLEALDASGWDHQTVFALLASPEPLPMAVNPAALSPIATMRVALAIPGRNEASITSIRAGSVDDVVATLSHLLGLKPSGGRNLLAKDVAPRSHFWVQEGELPQWGIRDGDWLYQASVVGTQQQLYNLAVDPEQSSNLAPLLPRQAALYRSLCATWFAVEGHHMVSNKSIFVANAQGWWLPMDLAMPGAKRVDFGITGERPVPHHTTMRRFHPYDPVIAQVSLRPFGEQRQLEFEWFGPAGRVDHVAFQVASMWNSVWVVPDRSYPMMPGRWTLLVSEQGTARVAGDFLVDPHAPRALPFATEPRALLEIAAGVYGPLIQETGSPEFQARERFTPQETPVVLTRWGPGPGVHHLVFQWRAPDGRAFVREQGLREEWEALRIELHEPEQSWIHGDWEVTVYEGGVLLGSIVVRIDGAAQ